MTDVLLVALDEAFDARSWHGTNLRGSLRGMDVATLAWRPGADRHNIWELAVHAAYWKYAVRRKLTGEKRGSFPLDEGSNFWKRPVEETMAAWKRDLALLENEHRALRDAVAVVSGDEMVAPAAGQSIHVCRHGARRRRPRSVSRRTDSVTETNATVEQGRFSHGRSRDSLTGDHEIRKIRWIIRSINRFRHHEITRFTGQYKAGVAKLADAQDLKS